MRYVWRIVNTGLVTIGLWDGYRTTASETLRRTNPDPILCGILLIIIPLFALGTVYYSKYRWDQENKILARPFTLRKPSWSRNPINWWGDPLQSLFISMCYMGAMAIGASLRHPEISSVGFWTFGVYFCFAIGLLVGQLLAYRVFRERITVPDA
ncbi:MAG TPA: hypothetical protein VLY23_17760 [Candidatus Acidoferrum sp.]|nr:hypothetical protein [Candidatus Acidoferrum sp.]